MVLKRKKLDAICALLKKTSAVDVNLTSQNGLGTSDAAITEHNKVKDGSEPHSTNNNEETATDLNENPQPVTEPSSEKAYVKPLSEDEGEQDPKLNPKSAYSTNGPSTSSTSITTTVDAFPPNSQPSTSSYLSTKQSTTLTTPSTSSGRRKSRKAAKPRLVFQATEQFNSDEEESQEREQNPDVQPLSLALAGKEGIALDSHEEDHNNSFGETSGFTNHYLQQDQLRQQHNETVKEHMNSSVDCCNSNPSGFPLDLSTSKTQNNVESMPDDLSHADNEDDEADDWSTRSSTAASSPAAVHATAQVSTVPVSAEAEGLADYATNTMNELLSIYGFGGAGLEGVDKQLAKKQVDMCALQALAAGAYSAGKILAAPPAHGGHGPSAVADSSLLVKLPNGQPLQRGSNHGAGEDLSASSSSQGQAAVEGGQASKLIGNSTKYKFHNVKPSIKAASGGSGVVHKVSSSEYNKYIKKFRNGVECGGSHCRDLGYRDHYHCHDCNFKVFIKKEEMVRHYKWHKKRDESLQHGFLRYSPLDDCSIKYGNCTHNKRQTHYHCIQSGCDKVYISTSDVQMHANYHRKDSAIIQEGFQRFRATEDCGTTSCSFYGQRTTHFHCRRPSCNFTFKHKADMEKHKSYHQKDEILGRDGFKKFMKYEHCSYNGCRFSKVSNHIHCIRPGCSYVLHSTAQLYSHKRKHERREFENLARAFRQTQPPQIQPGPRPLASKAGAQTPAMVNLPTAIPLGSKVSLTSIPLQGYGEPMVAGTMVAGQLLQRLPVPVKLEAMSGSLMAPNLTVVSAGAQTSSISSNPGVAAVVQPLALTSLSSLSLTNSSANSLKPDIVQNQTAQPETAQNLSIKPDRVESHISDMHQNMHTDKSETVSPESSKPSSSQNLPTKPNTIWIKEEPKSDVDSETDSVGKHAGTSVAQPSNIASKLENLKAEDLDNSLTLTVPAAHQTSKTTVADVVSKQLMIKPKLDAGTVTDPSNITNMMPLQQPRKRERDESWKNYLIRYTANDPCHSRCQLLYKDHYHCKVAGCQVLFRSKDGVREHAKFHDLQDRITPMVYIKYESTDACPQGCQLSQKQAHYHCNWTSCSHVVPEQSHTFARLEHYRIHEYAKAAAGRSYRQQSSPGASGRSEDLAHRRRGRPPKYPRLETPFVPKVNLSEEEIRDSSQRTADGEGMGADEKIINGFRKYDGSDPCPDDRCIYRAQLHYHCGRPRCHTATDRIDVLNLHAKDFHSFVTILENFEFFDRTVNCRRGHCNNNRMNRHYHCIRQRCDYSFVRHSTMTQHDKKHNLDSEVLLSAVSSSSSSTPLSPSSTAGPLSVATPVSQGTRITPIQLLRRDGQTYIPIVPAPATLDKNVVKAAGTFYPLSGLPTAVSATPVTMVASKGQPLTSNLTLTIPANLVSAGIPVMAPMASATVATPSTNMVPVLAGNLVAGAGATAHPLTVLLQQKPENSASQQSWSTMRNSMHYTVQASCGRPFCKLKKKDHYHCLECNQAFSDPARLRGHISKHGVKFKKLNQTSVNSQALSAAKLKIPGQASVETGLDLSTGRQRVEQKSEIDERSQDRGGEGDDDNDSLSSSLNLSIGKFTCLTQGDNSSVDASETNMERKLVIDEEADHSEDESMAGDDSINGNEDEDDSQSISDGNFNTGSSPVPSTSRRSGRKRSAPNHSDFVSSTDASLMAKQMKLKLSAPIPSTAPVAPISRNVPEGFIRFHCSSDCCYMRCAYRQSVTHFHCVRPECGYGFSDKSRILQHRFRHERLDKLMGKEFQQFRATVRCGRGDCEFSEKASHFHCQKCAFVCADSSKVLAHRKYHAKMDNITNNGFQKFGALHPCGMLLCSYSRRQTHYHCMHEGCNHAVLGPAQMAPHKLKHASHDV